LAMNYGMGSALASRVDAISQRISVVGNGSVRQSLFTCRPNQAMKPTTARYAFMLCVMSLLSLRCYVGFGGGSFSRSR
jgi:hypothetical protein